MPVSNFVNWDDMVRFLPEIILSVMGTFLMVLDGLLQKRSSTVFGTISVLSLIAALVGSVFAYGQAGPAFGGLLIEIQKEVRQTSVIASHQGHQYPRSLVH